MKLLRHWERNVESLRQELEFRNPKRLVVKIGSAAITRNEGGVDEERLKAIIEDLSYLRKQGIEVIIVSSGAIHAGKPLLKETDCISFKGKLGKNNVSFLQACSSIGQPILMEWYRRLFSEAAILCSQVLLIHDDFQHRKRFLNIRNTLFTLLKNDIIPILNENDSVSFEEITLGDNDQLAAKVATLIEADLMVILSKPDGLYDRDPSEPEAEFQRSILFDDPLSHVSTKGKTSVGRGGMETKLKAIQHVTRYGIPVLLGSYLERKPILRLLSEQNGSFFHPSHEGKTPARKLWISSISKGNMWIDIDSGASAAVKGGSSLLPSGIRGISSGIERGDCVQIKSMGSVVGVGLSEYSSSDLEAIKGLHSSKIQETLGFFHSDVVIHRDNLVIQADHRKALV